MRHLYKADFKEADNEKLLLQETIFHNANGYIGVRGCLEEGTRKNYDTIRGTYINGFYDFTKMNQAEKLCGLVEEKQTIVNVADTQTIHLCIDGEMLSPDTGKFLDGERVLDMDGGFTLRRFRYETSRGKQAVIEIRRMTSFALPSLFTIEYKVKAVNFSGPVEFISWHSGKVQNYCNPDDPRVAGESVQYLRTEACFEENGVSYILSRTMNSGLGVCSAAAHKINGIHVRENGHVDMEKGQAKKTIPVFLETGQEAVLEKYSIFTDSIRNPDCLETAKQNMQKVLETGLAYYNLEQERYLKHFWENSALEITGDAELSSAVHYNLYQLVQSVSKDKYGNIAAKGLSGEGYEGHYFWDTEMYIQPFFVLTNPEISRNLLSYRYEILREARENARILGHKKGALYPWRTIMGKECSGYFPSGSAQYHINGDIAYAAAAYYLATQDLEFMAKKGAEILFETARLWMDVGNYYNGTFQIHTVTGPDEYTCLVNNNYYTNVSAQYNLHWAVAIYQLLKEAGLERDVVDRIGLTEEELREFREAEEHMYLPYDEILGINPQDDSFLSKEVWDLKNTKVEEFPLLLHYHPMYLYRYQVCKQADTVLAHFIFEDAQSLETIRKSFLYYEKITTHDSSLSTCIYSIVASRLGMREKAYSHFGDSAKLDLYNTHKNTKDGIHTANMGGTYMAIVYGFAGLRLKETGLHLSPYLPEKWDSYRFCFLYHGSQIEAETDKEGTRLALKRGAPVQIFLYGKAYTVR
ncbi:glycoside hydrolase family 65 protein [Hungatella hathewayi]|uniref:Glycoside hydrolase family 65 protein n=1 Tax=Hungatella hathewayi TaxID=154046 RepID=A0A3E2WQK8_9FIRM|nr:MULTISPECIES: glycosyl hydrolase family 65 protein [Clostridia]RGC29502.1 glycoside hydrolase family 65 protein [Hungatella hathewayi]GKH31531.1 glycosyl hydrolase [Faecalicatena contorta]